MDQELIAPESDVRAGSAIVKAHVEGGWILPGGEIVRDSLEALRCCQALAELIDRNGGRARAVRAGAPRPRAA